MEKDTVVRVEGVYKDFVLPHDRKDSLKGIFTTMFQSSSKKNEKQHALKDISFEIKRGEFFGIVGRNGSGKSTLLKILAGIYQPTKGKVFTTGKLVPFIELGVGFNPELSGRDNVYLNGAMLGFSVKQVDAMYDAIVEFAELERFMDQKLKNYSSGMQVRLAFSMAVRAEADILLIDEVLAVGDADFQRKCFNYFKTLKKNNKTVIFVSHDMDTVRDFCDRALLINDSKIKSIGKTSDIANQYSRLFVDEKPGSKDASANNKADDKAKRWGNEYAKITDISLNKKVLNDKDKTLTLNVDIEVSKSDDRLMTGFRIKNAEGQTVQETNTWIMEQKLPDLKKGDSCSVNWEFPNIYTDGQYTVDAYVYGDGAVVFDSWEEVLSFQVKRPNARGFLVSITPELTIKKTKSNK